MSILSIQIGVGVLASDQVREKAEDLVHGEYLVELYEHEDIQGNTREVSFEHELEKYGTIVKKMGSNNNTLFNGYHMVLDEQGRKELKKHSEIKQIIPNYKLYQLVSEPVEEVNAVDVWERDAFGLLCAKTGEECIRGKGVRIAIIDSGIDYGHEAFGECALWEYTTGKCSKVIGGYDFVHNDDNPEDEDGHGTHVASIAAGMDERYPGVAPDASLYALRIFDGEMSTLAMLLEALAFSLDPNGDGNNDDKVDVVSLSLGSSGNASDYVSEYVNKMVEADVVVVAAAGNDGPFGFSISSPGTAADAITVGATNNEGEVAVFSSRGAAYGNEHLYVKPEVLAPGANICAAQVTKRKFQDTSSCEEGFVAFSGTSMATPMVAGAAALLRQAHPEWSAYQIKAALESTTDVVSGDLFGHGYGQINVARALELHDPVVIHAQVNNHIVEEGTILELAFMPRVKKVTVSLMEVDTFVEEEIEVFGSGRAEKVNIDLSEKAYGWYMIIVTAQNDRGELYKKYIPIKHHKLSAAISENEYMSLVYPGFHRLQHASMKKGEVFTVYTDIGETPLLHIHDQDLEYVNGAPLAIDGMMGIIGYVPGVVDRDNDGYDEVYYASEGGLIEVFWDKKSKRLEKSDIMYEMEQYGFPLKPFGINNESVGIFYQGLSLYNDQGMVTFTPSVFVRYDGEVYREEVLVSEVFNVGNYRVGMAFDVDEENNELLYFFMNDYGEVSMVRHGFDGASVEELLPLRAYEILDIVRVGSSAYLSILSIKDGTYASVVYHLNLKTLEVKEITSVDASGGQVIEGTCGNDGVLVDTLQDIGCYHEEKLLWEYSRKYRGLIEGEVVNDQYYVFVEHDMVQVLEIDTGHIIDTVAIESIGILVDSSAYQDDDELVVIAVDFQGNLYKWTVLV